MGVGKAEVQEGVGKVEAKFARQDGSMRWTLRLCNSSSRNLSSLLSATGVPRSADKPLYHDAVYDNVEMTQLHIERMQANKSSPSVQVIGQV